MLVRIRWKAVIVGAVVTYLLAMLLGLLNAAKFMTDLQYSLADMKGDGGVTGGTTEQWALLTWLSLFNAGFTSITASLLGGCVAGRMTGASGGLNGTVAAILGMFSVSGPFFFVVAISGGLLGACWESVCLRYPDLPRTEHSDPAWIQPDPSLSFPRTNHTP